MSSAIQNLLEILDLEQLEVNLFRGRSPQVSWQRVFGGQVIGQALVAACRTVDVAERPPHSLHAYFLLAGDPKVPIIYEVERVRDGKSFTTRRVKAIQHGNPIFVMSVSFHRDEPGLSHQAKMPDVPSPDELPSEAELKERVLPMMPEPVRRYYERERPIELRPVEYSRYLGKPIEDGRFQRLDPRHRAAAGRAGDPPMRAGLRLRHDAARFRADAAWPQRIREGDHGGEPRPRAVDASAVPRRRVASVLAGLAQHVGRARLLARADLHPRRHAGGVGGAGGAGADAAGNASRCLTHRRI